MSAAIGAFAGDSAGAQPMQITPPVARPPASIPAKPAKPKEKPKAAAIKRPVAKKPVAEPAPHPAPSAPTAFAPENPLVQQPFTTPEKPAQTLTNKTTALQPQERRVGKATSPTAPTSAATISRPSGRRPRRASEQGDPVAMTLLGDLYSNGYGVAKDEKKALAWFSLAADRGDRQAIFALAMARFAGRGGPQDKAEAAALLDKAAKLGHVAAAYNLALLYLEGQQVRQDIARAAELMRSAADAGSPEAQYALATLYKEGNGVAKDPVAAAKLLGAAARSGNIAAEVEYAIALFNGTGIDEGRERRRRAVPQGRAQGQCGGAEPARAHPGDRPRPAGRSDRGDEMAHHRQGRRRLRRLAGKLHAADQGRRARGGRERRAAVARARQAQFLKPFFTIALGRRAKLCFAHGALDPAVSLGNECAILFDPGLRVPAQSALLNVMTAAARKAARSLKRDFGEVANLQVSLKGPANFVPPPTSAPRTSCAPSSLKARPGYGFLGEEGGAREGTDKTHTWIVDPLDGTTNFLHGIPHFAISIALEREGTIVAGLIYNPANDEILHRRARQGRVLQRSAHPRRGAQAAGRSGRVLRAAASRARRPRAVPPGIGGRSRTRSRDCGASAPPRSISPRWRPGGSTSTGSAGSRRGISPPASSIVREAGGFVTDLDGNERTMEAGDIIAGNEAMHREVMDLLQGGVTPKTSGRAADTSHRSRLECQASLCYCRFCAIIAGNS